MNAVAKLPETRLENAPIQRQQLLQKVTALKKFTFSRHSDLAQRCLEYSLFPQNLVYLSQPIEKIDQNLSFLNSFVESALDQGAKAYKSSLKSQLQLLESQEREALKFQPYCQQTGKAGTNDGLVSAQNQRWGKQGYVKEEVQTKAAVYSMSNNQNNVSSESSKKSFQFGIALCLQGIMGLLSVRVPCSPFHEIETE